MAGEPATALLIVYLGKHIGNARAWRDTFGEQLPDLEVRIWPDAGNLVLRTIQTIQRRPAPRFPGEGRDPRRPWAPAFAGEAKSSEVLPLSCIVRMNPNNSGYRISPLCIPTSIPSRSFRI
jgi:hypothetical protein